MVSSVEAWRSAVYSTGFALTDRRVVTRLLSVLAVTLLVPFLFLMAVVVFYGCLLAHRLGMRSVAPRRAAATPVIDAGRRLAPAAPTLVARDQTAVRFLIVVSRQNQARYEELHRIFGGHGNTDVIFDRRRPDPGSRRIPPAATHHQLDRRQRHVDEDLRTTGWAMLRLTG